MLCKGLVEKSGLDNAEIHFNSENFESSNEEIIPDHKTALSKVVQLLLDSKNGVIKMIKNKVIPSQF